VPLLGTQSLELTPCDRMFRSEGAGLFSFVDACMMLPMLDTRPYQDGNTKPPQIHGYLHCPLHTSFSSTMRKSVSMRWENYSCILSIFDGLHVV
jgi:hypothetical protein